MLSAVRRQALRRVVSVNCASLQNSSSTTSMRLLAAVKPASSRIAQWPALSARLFSNTSFRRNPASEAFASAEPEDTNSAAKDAPLENFVDLLESNLIDKKIMKVILDDLKFVKMTEVQAKTVGETVKGCDVFAQAKTGTGKTIAFLLPLLQSLLNTKKQLAAPDKRGRLPVDIRALIITPTRELAQQVASDCEKLIKYIPQFRTQVAVGGANKKSSLRMIHSSGCNILVATPGRLYDLLTDENSGISTPNLETLVLDEADNLLDQGFAEDLKRIMRVLPPKQDRQTMLFSATVPEKVREMIRYSVKPNFKFLKFVDPNEVPTHQKVPQHLIPVKGFENCLPTLHELVLREMQKFPVNAETPFKAIVFFPTARYAAFAAQAFKRLRSIDDPLKSPFFPGQVIEIHSRLSQNQREAAADAFRRSQTGMLFSSDVTARGMDFPGVTHVIQVGMPMSLEQYIHRVGRTGRGGKSGLGYLILADIEFAETMKELGKQIKFNPGKDLTIPSLDMAAENNVPQNIANILTSTLEAIQKTPFEAKSTAFRANLGYYCTLRNKIALVTALNRWSQVGWGMEYPPPIDRRLVERLGLRGCGINTGTPEGGPIGRTGPTRDFNDGGFNPRIDQGGNGQQRFSGRQDGEGYKPRFDRDGGRPMRPFTREGADGFKPRFGASGSGPQRSFSREGADGFNPRFDRNESGPERPFAREGGGGFKPRPFVKEGGDGFKPRPFAREGGDGFKPRPFAREGGDGFKPRPFAREGGDGFKPRPFAREGGDGFKPRPFAREGGDGFKPRPFTRGGGDGFKPRFNRDGDGMQRVHKPQPQRWEGRGNVRKRGRF